MKKNNIIIILIASINLCLCLPLLIFMTPASVPLLAGIHDEIIFIGSKWWLLFGLILPLIFMTIYLCLKNKNLKLIFSGLLIFVVFNNLLGFSYFCTEQDFMLGEISKIPLSLSIFLPLSLAVFVYGSIIKNISYKNKLGIRTKNTTTTEFIWKQSHITASYHFRLAGLIQFISSIVFIFVHHPLIMLAIFVICLIIPLIVVLSGAKKMTIKYNDMKQKEANIKKNKA